jgi:hypothetical protein
MSVNQQCEKLGFEKKKKNPGRLEVSKAEQSVGKS